MSGGEPWTIVLILVFLLCSAFFSSSEAAFLSLEKVRLTHLVSTGVPGAERVAAMVQQPERLLSTILLGNNVVNVAFTAIVTALAVGLLGQGQGVVAATLVGTAALLIAGEIIPKTLAIHYAERVAFSYARPLRWIELLLWPIVAILRSMTWRISSVLGVKPTTTRSVTEAELRTLIDISTEEGAVAESTGELLERVFHFRDRLVKEMMVPRTEVVWLEKGTPLRDFYRTFADALHARFPVYDESIDNVVGIVGIKDVLRALAQSELDESSPVDQVLRPALYVPETKPVGGLFSEMQEGGHQIAIVVDEFGGTAGIVTLEMLLEEMVGRMVDELGRPEREFVAIDERTTELDAGLSIHEANEELGLAIPDGDYETVAGFVLSVLGHIPREGEQVQGDGFRMVVAEVQGVKIERVRVTKL